MKAVLEGIRINTEDVWRADLDPKSLLRLASPSRQGGKVSVMMVSHPRFNKSSGTLEFDLLSTQLLNLGNSGDTVIVDAKGDAGHQSALRLSVMKEKTESGDMLFLEQLDRLPVTQKELGKRLLNEIRQEFPGELKLTSSRKFVEQPDNFWTVKIQPQKKNFRITVYGKPQKHRSFASISVNRDRSNYYANFILERLDQLEDALNIIRNAKRLKDLK